MRAEHIGSGPMASPRTLPLQGSSAIGSGGCRRFDVLVPKLGLQQYSSSSTALRNSLNWVQTRRGELSKMSWTLCDAIGLTAPGVEVPSITALKTSSKSTFRRPRSLRLLRDLLSPQRIKHAQKVTKDCSYCMMLYVRHVLSVR